MKIVTINDIIEVINATENLSIGAEQITESLPDLGMDSITFIQIIVELEELFDCEVSDSKLMISEMNTVQKIFEVFCESTKKMVEKSDV